MAVGTEWRPLRTRIPSGLRELAPLTATRRILGWVLAAVLGSLLVGAAAWMYLDRPQTIADIALTGPRSPAPLDVVILLDESGSFDAYAKAREATIEQLSVWAPQNLRPDDTVTVISFASGAAVRLPMTPVGQLPHAQFDRGVDFDRVGTDILPALALAADLTSAQHRALIAVTDTDVWEADPSEADRFATQIRATSLSAVLPHGERTRDQWKEMFPWGREFWADPNSADEVSLALGHALAHATGQRVERARA